MRKSCVVEQTCGSGFKWSHIAVLAAAVMGVVGIAGIWPQYLGVAYCRICATALFAAAVLGLSGLELMVAALLTLPGAFLVAQGRVLAFFVPLVLGGPATLFSVVLMMVGERWKGVVTAGAFVLWFIWPLLGWIGSSGVLWPWDVSPLLWGESVIWGSWWPLLASGVCCGAAILLRSRA